MALPITLFNTILLFGLLSISDSNKPYIYPENLWVVSKPERQKVHSPKMMKALDLLKKSCGRDGLEEVVLIRNGFLIYEGDSVFKKHDIYECTKTFTGTVLGLLEGEYECTLNDYAADIDSDLSEHYNTVRLRHFANMTSGFRTTNPDNYSGSDQPEAKTNPTWQPSKPSFLPGKAFSDDSEPTEMMARLLTRLMKGDMKNYLHDRVMKPIGITWWDWGTEESAFTIPIRNGSKGIHMNALQMARFGHLFLSRGNWRGKQLIPEEWVEAATQPQVEESLPVVNGEKNVFRGNGRYGYNWYVRGEMGDMPDTPPGTFYMKGSNHNVCFVVPEWNLVFVRLGMDGDLAGDERDVYNRFFKELGMAIMD